MASSLYLQFYNHSISLSSKFCCNQSTSLPENSLYLANFRVDNVEFVEEIERPSFDINLAVILAGFAFEAYTTPPDNVGRRETDAADCMTVRYKSFDEIDEDKKWWRLPLFSEFLTKNGVESAIKMFAGSESVPVRQFVQYAFGQLKSLNDSYLQKDWLPSIVKHERAEGSDETSGEADGPLSSDTLSEVSLNSQSFSDGDYEEEPPLNDTSNNSQTNTDFWKSFAGIIDENVIQKLGIPVSGIMKWDDFEMINKIGFQSRKVAEAGYIESGLATPEKESPRNGNDAQSSPINIGKIQSSLPDIRKATEDILKQTDSIFSALMVLSAASPQLKESLTAERSEFREENSLKQNDDALAPLRSDRLTGLEEKKAEEMRALFSTAESAMEAWAMLATALGQPSLIKSEFEKICFLDNSTTDTQWVNKIKRLQVAIWRDSTRRRLVVAFRGTEQARWKDLRTDLMLAPAGLNPERIGGDFNEEVQVHSGFLSAYDSVRTRIMSLVMKAVGFTDESDHVQPKWHVYCTGHSLGGALATLHALELSSTQLAKCGAISVTMYNFGSPRVGNKRFAEIYNEEIISLLACLSSCEFLIMMNF
ncbi:putative feruloyl esterase A [Bienertia sinuspersici]